MELVVHCHDCKWQLQCEQDVILAMELTFSQQRSFVAQTFVSMVSTKAFSVQLMLLYLLRLNQQ